MPFAIRPLAEMVARGEVELPRFEDYVNRVVDFLELLPPECVIDRLKRRCPAPISGRSPVVPG